MNCRDLLKQVTKLYKQKKIKEAIKILDKAYSVGEFEHPSQNASDIDNFYTVTDLVRKAKYLNELGLYEDSISFVDSYIKKFNNFSQKNPWELYTLSELYNHRSIINKKSKHYNLAFIDKIKSFCLDGLANRYTSLIDKFQFEMKSEVLKNITKVEFIKNFLFKNGKKTKLKYDEEALVAMIIKIILVDDINKASLSYFDNLKK